ncbi:thioredoxin family protein [Sphingobacterium psychroaquaticum]|uniref:Thioredoxin-like domain-containing protein n=1 Tax=Sphingobacterium psychroaquaticum TaxID=561061 RepID=A0A1X7IP30_9SPHI|nr:thioredoxin fold domain-containing protein [Sphingobacterium psychroaquaticum]SMG16482.1 Thioredoxin-like domain-containing protein [Sphingobacterium psychroaquaticum]
MKKIIFVCVGFCLHISLYAQGIVFEQDKSWKEVLALAKKQGKSIFVDAYTTWCGPCIQMDKEVFPLPEVGSFYNSKFINYKLQMDKTKKDTEAIRGRYVDAAWFEQTFQIRSYPCYLFFDSNGNLIHQSGGGNLSGEAFVTIGKEALDPANTVVNMHKLYQEGNRSATFIKNYIQKMAAANDPQVETIAQAFIDSQTNRFSADAVDIMMYLTYGSDSPYFKQLLANKEQFIAAKGKEKVDRYFSRVIDAGITARAIKTSADATSGKMITQVDEAGLYSYFLQFYRPEEARLQTDFNVAKFAKLFDPERSYRKAKELLQQDLRQKLTLSQLHQLGNMVLRDGVDKADVELVFDAVKAYKETDELQNLQLFCKLYHFKGEQARSLQYAERAMDKLEKSRPDYVRVPATEFVQKIIVVMPTPKLVTN